MKLTGDEGDEQLPFRPRPIRDKDQGFWDKVHRLANGLPLEPVPGLETQSCLPAPKSPVGILPTYIELCQRLKALEERNDELCFQVRVIRQYQEEQQRIAAELLRDARFKPKKPPIWKRLFQGLDR